MDQETTGGGMGPSMGVSVLIPQAAPAVPETLEDCERIIERGLATFIDVGEALVKSRDDGLYRELYPDFESYCRDKWGFTRSKAYRLIDAADIVAQLPAGGAPENEAQIRELSPLRNNPAAVSAVWEAANEATGGKPTAKVIRETREQLYPPTNGGAEGSAERRVVVPQAKPLASQVEAITRKLGRDVEALITVTVDSGFRRQRAGIALANLAPLTAHRDALQSVIDQLSDVPG
jgi:hypothetical protein